MKSTILLSDLKFSNPNLSLSHVYSAIKRGDLKAHFPGQKWSRSYVRVPDLIAWLAEQV